jgi:hypothetical protein
MTMAVFGFFTTQSMIEHLKMLANKRDVPYQSVLKIFLSEKIEAELRK